jgi:hypothetical protein
MTVWESPLLAILAVLAVIYICASFFVIIRNIFRNPRPFFEGAGWLVAIAALIVGGAAIMVGGVLLYSYLDDQATLKKCLTAHERRAYADAAPDDYFGRQLRDAATAEARTCADFAAKKETEANKAHAATK